MKKLLICLAVVLFSAIVNAQNENDSVIEITDEASYYRARRQFNIVDKGKYLLIGDSIKLKKGSKIKLNLPYSKDYVSIVRESGVMKAINAASTATSLAGGVVGFIPMGGISGLKTTVAVSQVVGVGATANYAANLSSDAEKDLTNRAKKIYNQDFVIKKWSGDDFENDYELIGKIDGKRYRIYLFDAIILQEVSFYTE